MFSAPASLSSNCERERSPRQAVQRDAEGARHALDLRLRRGQAEVRLLERDRTACLFGATRGHHGGHPGVRAHDLPEDHPHLPAEVSGESARAHSYYSSKEVQKSC